MILEGSHSSIYYTGTGGLLSSSSEIGTITIRNLLFIGNKSNGCLNGHFTDLHVYDCKMESFETAIYFTYAWDILIEKTRIHNCSTPLTLSNQSNNITFNACFISSFSNPMQFTNAEQVTFIGCDITNHTTSDSFRLFQSGVIFIGCYFENLRPDGTITCGYNEQGSSRITFISGKITDSHMTICPYAGKIRIVDNLGHGKIYLKSEAYASDPASCGAGLDLLEVPEGYYGTCFSDNCIKYFSGTEADFSLEKYGTGAGDQRFNNGYYEITNTSSSSSGNPGVSLPMKVGHEYLLIIEGTFVEDPTRSLTFQQFANNAYSRSIKFSNKNNRLVVLIYAFDNSIKLRWGGADTLKLKNFMFYDITSPTRLAALEQPAE